MNNLRMGLSIMTKEDLYYDGLIDSMEEFEICETTGEIISITPSYTWDNLHDLI